MAIAKELRAQRYKIVTDAQALLNTAQADAEVMAKVDAMLADADELEAKIQRVEKADAMVAGMSEQVGAVAEHRHVSVAQVEDRLAQEKRIMTGLLKGGAKAMSTADREVYLHRMNSPQNTALSIGTNSAGGYTVAPLFFPELQVAMKQQGGMRQAARVLTTETGASLPFPLFDDRNQVASIVSENSQITEDTEPTFGQVSLGAYTYKSGVILVSLQLLNDSAFNFDELITGALASRFVRGQNAHFTTGDGSSKPYGVVAKAASGKVAATGQTTSIIYNDIVDLIHAVDPAFRPGASFMLHDGSLKVLRKLVDGQSRPLWQPGLVGGAPDTLLGYPIISNPDMPTMAANAKSVLFGNFSNYIIRDVSSGLQMMVLRERYADYLQVGVLGWMRSDGNLVSAASPIAYYANSAS